jgi:hypothetical protein
MNEPEDDKRDEPDADPSPGQLQLDDQQLDSVAGGSATKVDSFTIKQGIKSGDGENPLKGR